MPGVPVIGASEAVRAFQRDGWQIARQRGSHIINKAGSTATLFLPNHKPVARGTLRSLIRDAGLTVEEFCALL